MEGIHDFAISTHVSLQQPDVIFGIGTSAALALTMLTILSVFAIGLWTALIFMSLYLLIRLACREDAHLPDMFFHSLMQADYYRG